MSNISGASNYLNNQQLMTISDNIVGVSKTSNASLFNDLKRLDENKNEEIERPESGIAKLVSLGNRVLNKLATLLGIELNKPTNNQPMESFEDAQNEQIIDKYFKPISNKVINSSLQDIKENALDTMVSKEQIEYTFDAIIAEKQATNIKIISEKEDKYGKKILFSDGSEMSITKFCAFNYDGSQVGEINDSNLTLDYYAFATDGSTVSARLENFNLNDMHNNINDFFVSASVSDGNGPSEEDYNKFINNKMSLKELNEKNNSEYYTQMVNYNHRSFSLEDASLVQQTEVYDVDTIVDHTLTERGYGTCESSSRSMHYDSSELHSRFEK